MHVDSFAFIFHFQVEVILSKPAFCPRRSKRQCLGKIETVDEIFCLIKISYSCTMSSALKMFCSK